jgi:hypothetical protein
MAGTGLRYSWPMVKPKEASMKRTITLLALACACLAAHAAPPTLESIDRLLAISQADKLTEATREQIRASMRLVMDQMLQGQPNQIQRRAIDNFTAKVTAAMNEEFSPDRLRPIYVVMYRENFTQEEVDALIAFYQSPLGQTLLTKMPRAMQGINSEMSRRMGPVMERMRTAAQEMDNELGAAQSRQRR